MSATDNILARELEEVEDDRDALLATLAQIEASNQETIPGEVVWRAARLDVELVRRIERNAFEPGVLAMAEIARALRPDMEMFLPVADEGRARG